MRNDVCFPCHEHPSRCYFVAAAASVVASDDPSYPPDKHHAAHNQQQVALSCNRKGQISANTTKKSSWEEWCLLPEGDAEAGVYKIFNAAHNLVLVCELNGTLRTKKLTTTRQEEEDLDCWSIEYDDNGMARIRSFVANCYLTCSAFGNSDSVSDDDSTGSSSKKSDTSSKNKEEGDHIRKMISAARQRKNQSMTQTARIIQTSDNPKDPTTQWRLEYLTGELCYMQLAQTDKLLLCDNFGNIKTSTVWGGWEVWRFIEAGNDDQVRISSWTHHHKLLACNAFGHVTTTEDRFSDDTLWKVQKAPPGLDGVLIVSVPHGKLLRSTDDTISSSGFIDGVAATWQLTAAHRQRYYISSIGYDRRLALLKDSDLTTTIHRRDCEVWELQKLDNGLITIQSEKFGRLLQYDGQGLGVSFLPQQDEEEVDVRCRWRIVEAPTGQGGVCIVSAVEPFLALSCNQKGELDAVDHQGPFECWNLEPCMPTSLQQWQINLMIGGAVGAALLAPAIAYGTVAMLGVGAEVVAASSVVVETAAVATATETTAAAVSLGVAGTTAAMSAGAAVGLSATGIVVATSQRDRSEGTDLRRAEQNRPFCEWRSW